MRPQFIGLLSGAQALLLLVKVVAVVLGRDVSWFIVLAPVWALIVVAGVFWTVFGLVVHLVG